MLEGWKDRAGVFAYPKSSRSIGSRFIGEARFSRFVY